MVFDITVVGHFSLDFIFLPDKLIPYAVLGGSATYVSFAAKRLDAAVSVVSKVGGDFPEAYLQRLKGEGIDLSAVAKVDDAQSTSFELIYDKSLSSRVLRLKSRAPPLTVEDLPRNLRTKVVHIAPIAGEVTFELFEKLRGCAEILSFDPQGLVRIFDGNGNVTYGPLRNKEVFGLVDVYKSSLDEVKAATGFSDLHLAVKAIHDYGVKVAIVTLGAKGAVLSTENVVHKIMVYKSNRVVDPTGAGDAFIGGFLAEYLREKDPIWCACVGSAIASLAIESVGPTFPCGKKEIYRRAHLLYGKGIKE